MKTAIGLMACIAIAFLYITSPDSGQTYASVQYQRHQELELLASQISDIEQSIQQATQKLLTAQLDARADQATQMVQFEQKMTRNLNDEMESRFTSAKTEQAWGDEELRAMLEEMKKDLDDLKVKQSKLQSTDTAASTVAYLPASSTVSFGSTGSMAVKSYGSSGSSSYSSSPNTKVSYSNTRSGTVGRWQNHDGLSFREHAEVMHGINTSGLSDQQIAMMRDHDHDTYGAGHPPQMRASRTVSRTVDFSESCPGGICPTSNSGRVVRSGVLGFGILGRRR